MAYLTAQCTQCTNYYTRYYICPTADDVRGPARATRASTRQQQQNSNLVNRVGTSLVALDNRLRHILNNERDANGALPAQNTAAAQNQHTDRRRSVQYPRHAAC